MPLLDFNKQGVSEPENPNIQPAIYKDIVVDSRRTDLRQLITHVDGMKWVLPYYFSQYVAADNEVAAHEINREGVYQQYLQIKNLEIRVTSPYSPQQDTASKEFTLTGTATLFPGLIPNVGDTFIADVGDGRSGIFNVKSSSRKTILQDSTYEIEFEFVEFSTPGRLQDLLDKTVKVQTFVKEFIFNGQNPYLTDVEIETFKRISYFLDTLPDTYFDLFYDQEYGTLLVPDQNVTMYDPYAVAFFKAVTSIDTHPRLESIRSIHCDTARSKSIRTIFDALLKSDENVLDTASLKSQRYHANTVINRPEYGGIRYSGIDQLYYTTIDEITVGRPVTPPALRPSKDRTFNRPLLLEQLIAVHNLPEEEGRAIPVYHPVTIDDYYVFSEAFYGRIHNQKSLLEIMVSQRLTGSINNTELLLQVVDQAEAWGRLEQYYYYPVLIYLLHLAIRDIN